MHRAESRIPCPSVGLSKADVGDGNKFEGAKNAVIIRGFIIKRQGSSRNPETICLIKEDR
jgi:hypothetical protein